MEVMIAMVILSISLIVLMDSQARSMDMVARAKSVDVGTSLATLRMTELVQEAKEKGVSTLKDEAEGEFDQQKFPTYRWRYWKKNVPAPDFAALAGGAAGGKDDAAASNKDMLAGPLQAIGKVWGNALKELHVEVSWGEERKKRTYELVTHLIATDALAQLQGAIGILGGTFGGKKESGGQNPQREGSKQ